MICTHVWIDGFSAVNATLLRCMYYTSNNNWPQGSGIILSSVFIFKSQVLASTCFDCTHDNTSSPVASTKHYRVISYRCCQLADHEGIQLHGMMTSRPKGVIMFGLPQRVGWKYTNRRLGLWNNDVIEIPTRTNFKSCDVLGNAVMYYMLHTSCLLNKRWVKFILYDANSICLSPFLWQ